MHEVAYALLPVKASAIYHGGEAQGRKWQGGNVFSSLRTQP
jgi:hypothetical protein